MKLLTKFFFTAALVFFISVISAQNFEGIIKFKVTYEGEASEMKYQIKDGKFRMDAPDNKMGGGAFLMDDKSMYILMPSQKMYMEMPIDVADMDVDTDDMTEPNRTGETKVILGHEAEKWLMKDNEEDIEMWVAKDLGKFVLMNGPMQEQKPAWYKEIENDGFFPMLVINRDKSGNEVGRYEVTELKEQKLSDDLFNIPSGYTKMSMPKMFEK